MLHAFTIVELLLVLVDFYFCWEHFGNNKVLKRSKCQRMFSSIHILLKDDNIKLNMMAYTYILSLWYENSDARFPKCGAGRTSYLMYDIYTNDSLHGVCFPTVI